MVNNDYDERSYQDWLDNRFYQGSRPSEKAPFTIRDIVYLLARIYIHLPKDADLKRLQSFDDNEFKWRKTCRKCGIDNSVLRNIIRKVRLDYKWLKHRTKDGHFRSFTLREIVSLVMYLMRNFEREDWDLIMALYDTDWNIEEIIIKHEISRDGLYRFLRECIKKPILKFLSHLD